jgi:hypothetical protein
MERKRKLDLDGANASGSMSAASLAASSGVALPPGLAVPPSSSSSGAAAGGAGGGSAAPAGAAAAAAIPALNPLTGRPYSKRYREIYEQRRTLPVWQFLDRLEGELRSHQVVVVEGETGSGKTTQVRAVVRMVVHSGRDELNRTLRWLPRRRWPL